jgi:hypothetical protein
MKTISNIRDELELIQDALTDIIPPEFRKRGSAEALTIFKPLEGTLDWGNYPQSRDIESSNESDPSFDPIPQFEYPPEIEKGDLNKILSSEAGKEIAAEAMVKGIDAYGWYLSFHYLGPQWGIYIPKSRILLFAIQVYRHLNCDLNKKLQLAFYSIMRHELCHFFVDYFSAQFELIVGRACYLPAAKNLKDQNLGYNLLEEQLANAWMLRGLRYPEKRIREDMAYSYLISFTINQPPGYRDGIKIIDKPSFIDALNRLCSEYSSQCPEGMDLDRKIPESAVDLYNLYPFDKKDAWKYCAIHIIDDMDELGLPSFDVNLFPFISRIIESRKFSKMFGQLSSEIQKKWKRVKQQLGISTGFPGLDFKKFPKAGKNVYSVRVDKSYRCHLLYNSKERLWTAFEIGSHKKLGHG